ncbi:very short patch repair endonuclease [Micromonospora krabiensis]|uniref:T/G mismatch-specific endonuclease n=1 Tax=Micromonospora krabiensis TaxID=307121 RepID=A0A1C3N6V2_9ACTN|nr:very short patch repair endonuclease [Micromonospora krabiensis]SBV28298.1 T/G mismatch-specific endonuclease [Micromonospora krabiensis]
MPDHLSKPGRSRVMAAIRSKNTKPELMLRQALRTSGATGYRIHLASLPGKPDIAYTRWRLAIFVDGVFWHGHPDHFKPELASEYWRDKIARNQERDRSNDAALTAAGWTVLRIWDMQVKDDLAGVTRTVSDALRALGRPDLRQ